jgi:hypothetical protein
VTPPTSTPTGTPITPEHVGYRVRCVRCNLAGEIDEVTPGGTVIVRHDALAWCVILSTEVQPLEFWHAAPPRPRP